MYFTTSLQMTGFNTSQASKGFIQSRTGIAARTHVFLFILTWLVWWSGSAKTKLKKKNKTWNTAALQQSDDAESTSAEVQPNIKLQRPNSLSAHQAEQSWFEKEMTLPHSCTNCTNKLSSLQCLILSKTAWDSNHRFAGTFTLTQCTSPLTKWHNGFLKFSFNGRRARVSSKVLF